MPVILMKNIEFSKVLKLEELVDYQEGRVISRTLAQLPQANITLFALAQGEGISTHTTAGDAMVQILDGEAEITIGEQTFTVKAGETIVMPQDVPHALEARNRFKMLLTVIKR
ncbi:MAG: cupin domain-containing protein [Firmicutes bacterium]|nr:cupin domain-containing protein [Bacillota bacterium]